MNTESNLKKYIKIKASNEFGIIKTELQDGVFSILTLSGELRYLKSTDFDIVDFSEIITRIKTTSEKIDFDTLTRLSGSCDICRSLVFLLKQIINKETTIF